MEARSSAVKSNFSLIKRRRDLIPIWMKPFIFLFLAFGALGIYGIVNNIMGIESSSSLYGLESTTFFSFLGVFLNSIFFFKAITSYGLWMEKDWAINLGIIDAVLGILVCIVVMVVLPFVSYEDGTNKLNIRFEFFLLIPYLYQLIKIKNQWENFNEISKQSVIPTASSSPAPIDEKTIPKVEVVETNIFSEPKIDKEDHSRFMPK